MSCPQLVSGFVETLNAVEKKGSCGSAGAGDQARGKKEEKECPAPWKGKLLMAPPFYADLGKQASDVFGRGYHFGLLKLNVKTKTDTGVEFTTGGTSDQETGTVSGNLETKYTFKEYGVTFSEKWNTDNVLATEVSLSDFCDGAKLSIDSSFAPQSGDKTLKMKASFKNGTCALNLDSDFKSGAPVIKGGAVFGYSGWLCGYQTSFDTSESKLTENKFAMGFVAKDFILHTNIDNGSKFGGSLYHRVNNKLETGVQLSWMADTNETTLGIGCKYNLDPDAALRLKVDNKSVIGLGYSQRLRDGVTMYLSTQVNGKDFNAGGHKVGFCLELEA